MALKVALQMDPIGSVNINGDSTFRIALEAQARGHSLFFYTPDRLAYVEAVNKLARTAPEFALMEYYYRCRLIQDYISGMTDLYAWDEYRRLMAVE